MSDVVFDVWRATSISLIHEGAASDTCITVETRYVCGALSSADEVYGVYHSFPVVWHGRCGGVAVVGVDSAA